LFDKIDFRVKEMKKIGLLLVALVFLLASCQKYEDVSPEELVFEKTIRDDQRPDTPDMRDFDDVLGDEIDDDNDGGAGITDDDDDDDDDDDGITDDDDDEDDDDDSKKSSN
jgi:hypothetical protein